MTKQESLEIIARLVERFEEQYDTYKTPAYDEAKTRLDFINKFFKALGWDGK